MVSGVLSHSVKRKFDILVVAGESKKAKLYRERYLVELE